MNADPLQSQLQLQAMRPNGQDDHDPGFTPALNHKACCPELQQWHDKWQHFDRELSRHLCCQSAPDTLHTTILAGIELARSHHRKTRRNWLLGIGLAASLAITLPWLISQPSASQSTPALAEFVQDIIQHLESKKSLDHLTPSASEVTTWLTQHQALADLNIPVGLSARDTIGCKIIDWHGKQISLVCFCPCPSGNPQSAPAHLFVLREEDLSPELLATLASQPTFSENQAYTSAAWRHNGKLHLVLTRSPLPHLQSLFQS